MSVGITMAMVMSMHEGSIHMVQGILMRIRTTAVMRGNFMRMGIMRGIKVEHDVSKRFNGMVEMVPDILSNGVRLLHRELSIYLNAEFRVQSPSNPARSH